jgi:ATP-dependent DNA helicase RecG
MPATIEQLHAWMQADEDRNLEFKEAKGGYHFEELVRYCVALANEGGGRIILGVTDRKPRRVVGSEAFDNLPRTEQGIVDRLHLKVVAEELRHPDGRVVIFHVPARPLGMPIQYQGAYWMRAGDELTGMTTDMLRVILAEVGPDFSAEFVATATMADLDADAIEEFRKRWIRKSGNAALAGLTAGQLLEDAELVSQNRVTYAALVLFGTCAALGRHLASAEVVFEYRSSEGSTAYQQREEFRSGFFLYQDSLWALVNLRNDTQQFRDGLFAYDIPTFDEDAVREALLNAVAHRDYRLPGSVFVRQFPRRLEIVSPGGFPAGVTAENIFHRQQPRNRRIAEAFARCGLVERSGQGVDRIFRSAISQAKPLPSYVGSDAYQVQLTLRGEITDPGFLRFLEKIGEETVTSFTIEDFLLLDAIRRDVAVPEALVERLPRLRDLGLIETVGRGRGTRPILSRRFYSALGQAGAYTRRRGLDHETNKALLEKHLRDAAPEGCALSELHQVLPNLSARQVSHMLKQLRDEGRAELLGARRWGRWFAPKNTAKNTMS